MPSNILMPALSPTMEVGSLAKWYVKEGDNVSAGDILAEIETDKATMEFETVDDGKITKIFVPAGTRDIPVNSKIAEITLEDDNDIPAKKIPEVLDKKMVENESIISKSIPTNKINEIGSNESKTHVRIKISPLAKRIALNNNIDISNILGSGPNGRIIKTDILNFVGSDNDTETDVQRKEKETEYHLNSQSHNSESLVNLLKDRQHKLIPITGLRKIVAERLTEAKKTIPHFYLRRSIQIDKLLNLRAELNESFENKEIKFSINDFVIKAAAISLQDNPRCNAIWGGEDIVQLESSDISVAVAISDGLITPIIWDADKKNLQEISQEMKEKAKKAKERKLLPEDYTGGSFSISNLGMLGVENFDAVINPPQASILAVGSSVRKPVIDSLGNINAGNVMSVTLSADHRIIDGAVGAIFLNSITEYLSNPLKILV